MNKEECGRTLGEYQKKIKDLEERIAMMDATDSALVADLEHWKRVAAGYKGNNRSLSKRIEHYKRLESEGNELYEKALEKIEEKNKIIIGLQSQVSELTRVNKELDSWLKDKQDLIDELDKTIEELRTPWWKRIFGIW